MASRGTTTSVLVVALLFVIFAALLGTSTWAKGLVAAARSADAVVLPSIAATHVSTPVHERIAVTKPSSPEEAVLINRGQTTSEVVPFSDDSFAAPI